MGLYALGSTCSSQSGQGYASSYTWGNVTSRTFSGITGALSYNSLNELVEWNAGSNNQEWYVYDASGNRVLRRSKQQWHHHDRLPLRVGGTPLQWDRHQPVQHLLLLPGRLNGCQ
jgi:YD repeat-containing protein